MRKKLDEFLATVSSGKQLSSLTQGKNAEMYNWIIKETQNKSMAGGSISERIYLILNPEVDNTCCNGKVKRFDSYKTGYRNFCGPAATCPKCNASVSKNSAESHAKRTSKDIEKSNKKREDTHKLKTGVTNNSKLPGWKEQCQERYEDTDLVMYQNATLMNTMFDNHGVFHPMELQSSKDAAVASWLEKYKVTHPMKCQTIVDKVLETKDDRYPKGHLAKTWGYDRFKSTLLENYELELLCEKEDYEGSYQTNKFDMMCIHCKNIFNASATYTEKTRCKICHPIEQSFCSKEETAVFEYIKSELGIDCYQRDRSMINPFELDIVIPSKKIAIEYCGLYWHSENSSAKNRQYHLNKLKLAEEKGYRLITIFSDEWNLKNQLTKNTLRFILGKEDKRIFAKHTMIKKITFKEVTQFLKDNHLQGKGSPTSVNYGLFHCDNLVSCMTFSKPRILLGGIAKEGAWELVRFCSTVNVVGGASKLFAKFIEENKPEEIVSYCDKRWFTGKIYTELKFSKDKDTEPNYWYTDKTNRYSRTKFTKQTLIKEGFDPNKSEWDIMQERGFDRIWDCGNYKFIWRK